MISICIKFWKSQMSPGCFKKYLIQNFRIHFFPENCLWFPSFVAGGNEKDTSSLSLCVLFIIRDINLLVSKTCKRPFPSALDIQRPFLSEYSCSSEESLFCRDHSCDRLALQICNPLT